MAHRALTPRLLGALRLAPSDGDVSAPEETRVRTQEGPWSPGGLGTETNTSIVGISPPGLQPHPDPGALLIRSVTLGKSLGISELLFCIYYLGMVVTMTSESFVSFCYSTGETGRPSFFWEVMKP